MYRYRLAFAGCIERLQQLIDQESEALRSGEAVDFEEFNSRKSHALLEFTRASRFFPVQKSATIEARLARLRASLVENSSLLEQHLRAMGEISGIMIRTIEMAESDGTYSHRIFADRHF